MLQARWKRGPLETEVRKILEKREEVATKSSEESLSRIPSVSWTPTVPDSSTPNGAVNNQNEFDELAKHASPSSPEIPLESEIPTESNIYNLTSLSRVSSVSSTFRSQDRTDADIHHQANHCTPLQNENKLVADISPTLLKLKQNSLLESLSVAATANPSEMYTNDSEELHESPVNRLTNITFEKINVQPDGNCLFRALSYALFDNEDHHEEIRRNVVEYVLKNFDDVAPILLATAVEIKYRNAAHYKSVMEKQGTFGTDFELGMFARLYRKRIVLWTLVNGEYKIYAPIEPASVDGKKTINILFTGKLRSGHFDFLVEKVSSYQNENDANETLLDLSSCEHDSDNDLDKEVEYFLSGKHSIYETSIATSSTRQKTSIACLSETPEEIDTDTKISSESSKKNVFTEKPDKNAFSSLYDFHESDNELAVLEPYKSINVNKKIDQVHHQIEKDLSSNSSKSSSLSDLNNKSIEEEERKSSTELLKKEKIYTENMGSADVLTHSIADGEYIDLYLLRHVIHTVMENEIRCKCPLSFRSGIRRNETFWVLYALCYVRSHSGKFRFDVYEKDENYIRIYISSNTKLSDHPHGDEEIVCRPIRGKERKEKLRLLKYRCARSVYLEDTQKCDRELLCDGHGQMSHNLHVYYKIKSEAACAERKRLKSRDIEDLTQSFIDDATNVDPFIRQVSLPLQVLLYTKAQLDTVKNTKSLILHFDSTGANINNPQFIRKGAIFYYCLIHRASKSSIPLAEMLTSQHDIPSISIFLKKYKAFVRKELDTWPLAKAIVTDWSWALMNSIMFEWNNMNIERYLQITYNYVTKRIVPKEITFLLSCCAHTMHRMSRTIKHEFPELLKIKSFLLECMALLILCRDIESMNLVFRDILEIILTKNQESVKIAFDLLGLRKEDKRKKESLRNLLQETQELEEKELELNDEFLKLYSKSKAIYTKSPFYEGFWTKLAIAKDTISTREGNIAEITNLYYAPEFADFLTIHYMPYCPIWSCLVIDLVDPNISRVSNAYVESYNKTYKEIVLKGKKRNTIGDVCRALREQNKYLVAEENVSIIKEEGTITVEHTPIYPETASNPFQTEKWGRKRRDITQQKTRKKRHAHMEGKEIIKINRKLNESTETKAEENTQEKKKLLKKKANLETGKQDIKYKVKRAKKDISVTTVTIPKPKQPTKVTIEEKTISVLSNGLTNDVLYYLLSDSILIKIGSYSAREDSTVVFKRFQLSANNFKRLGSLTEWLDGDIIDAYVACRMKEWKEITYFPTDIGGTVLGDNWKMKHNNKLRLMNIKEKLNSILLLPYSFNYHWRLLVVKPEKKEITLMDPYGKTYDEKRVVKAFQKYINESNDRSTLAEMRKIEWKLTKSVDCPLQCSNDTSNCGLYVIHYMECIGNGCSFDEEFKPGDFRRNVAETLIQKADNVLDKCLHCMGNVTNQKATRLCSTCKRQIHEDCISNNLLHSEDEQELCRNENKKRKKLTNEKTQEFDRCRLCQKYLRKINVKDKNG